MIAWYLVISTAFASRDDLAFVAAQESFVQAAEPLAGAPEPSPLAAISGLGNPCYSCRERATRRLAAASVLDPRWLFWTGRLRDAEVRRRAQAIADRLLVCRLCEGRGNCPGRYRSADSMDRCFLCGAYRWRHGPDPAYSESTGCPACGSNGRLYGVVPGSW